MSPPSSGSKNKPSKILLATCVHTGFLLGLFFDTEEGCVMFLRNVGRLSVDYTVIQRNMSPPSSGSKNKPSNILLATCFHTKFFLGLFFDTEEGCVMFLRNVGRLSMYYTMFQRNMSPPSSGCKNKPSNILITTCFHAGFFLGLLFDTEERCVMFLRNVG
jgi:RsiW-degrading membrane proteinase PrsW (M82 family)